MAGRMFGDYGPFGDNPQSSSRVVQPPQQFDLRASIDRIRAARERAAAEQEQAQQDESELQDSNVRMRDDSEDFMNVEGAMPWSQGLKNQLVDGSTRPWSGEGFRAPGALTQEQEAEALQERTAARFQNQAAAQRTTADREDAAAQKVTDDRQFEDMWTGMGVDQQVNDMWQGMAAEGNAQMQGQDIVPDNKDVEAKEAKRAGGIRDMTENQMAASEARIHTPVVSEASPEDAPLPGEETLPPAVARWNSERAMRGNGGLTRLHKAYAREVPEGTRGIMTFEKWLDSKGIDGETDYNTARANMNRVADSRQETRIDQKTGKPVTTNVALNTDVAGRKKSQFLQTMARRYANEIATGKMTLAELEGMYDSGAARGTTDNEGVQMNDPHLAGTRAVNGAFIDKVKANRSAQVGVNLDNHREQMARAQQFRMPVAQVKFFDSLQQAENPQAMANVLMLAHSSQPRMGWDKMAFMLMKGEVDMQAMQNWAGQNGANKPTAANQLGNQLNDLYAAPITPATLNQIRFVAQNTAPPNATADQMKQHEKNTVQPLVRKAANSPNMSDHELMLLQQTTAGMDPKQFYDYCGLNPQDPRSEAVYKKVFGATPPIGFWNAAGNLAGRAAQGVAGAAGAMLGVPMPGPAAWAQQVPPNPK